jgi:hypothetical protein
MSLMLSVIILNGLKDVSICLGFKQKSICGKERKLLSMDLHYKTFYGRNLQIFVISESVCPWKAFPV